MLQDYLDAHLLYILCIRLGTLKLHSVLTLHKVLTHHSVLQPLKCVCFGSSGVIPIAHAPPDVSWPAARYHMKWIKLDGPH